MNTKHMKSKNRTKDNTETHKKHIDRQPRKNMKIFEK